MILDRVNVTMITLLTRMISVITRTVHANPMTFRHLYAITGKTIPPVAAPHEASETAITRLVLKYVAYSAIIGLNRSPWPIPLTTPCANQKCHNFVPKEVAKAPITWKKQPVAMQYRR